MRINDRGSEGGKLRARSRTFINRRHPPSIRHVRCNLGYGQGLCANTCVSKNGNGGQRGASGDRAEGMADLEGEYENYCCFIIHLQWF